MNPTRNTRLVSLLIPAALFGTTIETFGAKNIIVAAANRSDDTMLVIGKINDDKVEALKSADTKVLMNEAFMTDAQVNIDSSKYAQIATIERRNGQYAFIADANFAKTPAFDTFVDQVKKKRVAAFDTVAAHLDVDKKTWFAPMGQNPRVLFADNKDVTCARFNLLGLVLKTKNDTKLQLATYGDLATWYDDLSKTNIDDKEAIYTADNTIRSISHVNAERLVVNTDDGKYVLDLKPLRTPGNDAKLLDTDTEHRGLNFAGKLDNAGQMDDQDDTIVYVDFDPKKTVARFVPVSKVTKAMQTYAGYDAATAK